MRDVRGTPLSPRGDAFYLCRDGMELIRERSACRGLDAVAISLIGAVSVSQE